MLKGCTSSLMNVEENIPIPYMMPASSTSKKISTDEKYLSRQTSHFFEILGHGMDIMMNLFGELLGYTKQLEMLHTSTRPRNTTTILAWKVKPVSFPGTTRLLEYMY